MKAVQLGCSLAQLCCMTFSLGCNGSALLLFLSVSVEPHVHHLVHEFCLVFFFFFLGCFFLACPQHLLNEWC